MNLNLEKLKTLILFNVMLHSEILLRYWGNYGSSMDTSECSQGSIHRHIRQLPAAGYELMPSR